jgi:hypothetical protein
MGSVDAGASNNRVNFSSPGGREQNTLDLATLTFKPE